MAAQIPLVQTQDQDFLRFQTQLQKVMQPVLDNAINFGTRLSNVVLASGLNVVPTTLNRNLQGWFIIRQRAEANIWDTQDSNSDQSQSLYLNASTAVTVDLWVF